MCGIAGLIGYGSDSLDPKRLGGFDADLLHRGPDDSGFLSWSTGDCPRLTRDYRTLEASKLFLLHRRLSILDLTESGWQPILSPDKRFAIVFNGEIYNYLELKAELKTLGHSFVSTTDSEVLLHAYLEWGKACLDRLIGMFAFAILDTVNRKLFLARDFFGIKPLFYTKWQQGFAFASELKSLIKLPGVSRQVNAQRLYDYVRFGVTDHGSDTMFEVIKQIPAAHFLELSLDSFNGAQSERYWQPEMQERTSLSFKDAAEKLRELFLTSVRFHLRSDVPVGSALSGGIDSSSIVMAMRHLEPDLELHTFSYTPEDEAINEEPYIDIVAKAAKAIVHKVSPTQDELVNDLDELVSLQNEPFGSTSIYAQYRVFKLAREAGIKVLLSGQGADEQLGGYSGYRAARLASLVRRGQLPQAYAFWRQISQCYPQDNFLRISGLFLVPPKIQGTLRKLVGKDLVPNWLEADWLAGQAINYRALERSYGVNTLHDFLHLTLTQTSVPMLLRYEDRNSMTHSLESRVPFLTPQLAQFILSLPAEYIIDNEGTTKAVFRAAMRGIVPDAILDRKDKIGFQTPEQRWFTTLSPWIENLLSSENARTIPIFKHSELLVEWQAIKEKKKPFDFRVWRWVNLIAWVKKFNIEFP